MNQEDLREIVTELLSRPGHEKVRAHLHRLLTDGLGAKASEIDFERQVPEVRGRIDALLGRTVFEIKSDLRRGRESVHYRRALQEIERLWTLVQARPEAILKRDLWYRLLRVAYGGDVEAPGLFLQHTYLTIVAKSVATLALFDTMPATGEALLS